MIFNQNENSLLKHADKHAAGGTDPITPDNIGAVDKTGDTMTGNLAITKNNPYFKLENNADTVRQAFVQLVDDSGRLSILNRQKEDTSKYSQLLLDPESVDLSKVLRISVNGSGYDVLHSGNKNLITPADIGAADEDHSHTVEDVGAVSSDDCKFRIVYSLSDIDITESLTMSQLFAVMPSNTILIMANNTNNVPCVTDAPGTYGLLTVKRRNGSYNEATWAGVGTSGVRNGDFYYAAYDSAEGGAGFSGWFQLIHTGNKNLIAPADIGAADEDHSHTVEDVGALPISGGTLTGTSLGLNSGLAKLLSASNLFQMSAYKTAGSSANSAHLLIYNSADLESILRLAVYDASGTRKNYDIHHTGNKPTGSYTGNGDATARTIETGGAGKLVMITSPNGLVMLTNSSGFLVQGGSSVMSAIAYSEGHVEDGVITIASTDSTLNTNGETYYYQLL